LAIAAGAAVAQPTLDGVVDTAFYGSPLAVQDTPTGFGDSDSGAIDFANGSELDAAYGRILGDTLYITVTGNLEANFNKLELFIDSIDGGQNRLRGDNPDIDFNGLNRMGDDGSGNGLTFDDLIAPDFFVTFTGGDTGGGVYQTFANYAQLLTAGGGDGFFLGDGAAGTSVLVGSNGIQIAIDNSNTAGVTSVSGDGGELVATGIELAIPLAAIGNPTGDISVTAFVNAGGHDFLSNQVLGGVGGLGNLGEPRSVDFSAIDGQQFFTVAIPSPSAASLMLIAGMAGWRRRR